MTIHKKITFIYGGLVITGLIFAFFALALSFYKATILITPKEEETGVTFSTKIFFQEEENPQAGDRSLGQLFEETLEGEKEYTVPGSKILEGLSLGKIKVVNEYSKAQILVKTTRFCFTGVIPEKPTSDCTEDEVLFRSTHWVEIPAEGEAEVEIQAVEKGTIGDVGPGKFRIPGLFEWKQKKIYGMSEKPLAGGLMHVGQVLQKDIDQAKEELQNSLFEEFSKKIPVHELNSRGLKGLAKYENLVSFSSTAKAGDEVGKFSVKMKLRAAVVALEEKHLLALALEELKRKIPKGKILATVGEDSFQYWVQSYSPSEAEMSVSLTGKMVITLEAPILADKTKLTGLSPEEAKNYLENFSEIEKAEVRLRPFWTKILPKSAKHIEIKIKK